MKNLESADTILELHRLEKQFTKDDAYVRKVTQDFNQQEKQAAAKKVIVKRSDVHFQTPTARLRNLLTSH